MIFDVLSDPWIPVKDYSGAIKRVGIVETIENANVYQEISHTSPIVEFGIYRLLFVFLMDAYRPEVPDDLEDIYFGGRFDTTIIKSYIEKCKKEGTSFNLFDDESPFFQIPLKQWGNQNNIKSVAYLDPALPTGNNHVHFNHQMQDSVKMEAWQVAQYLPSLGVFCTAGAQKYPSGVNGAPPLFTIVKGKNLFETLLYGMVPSGAYENYADPGPIWNSHIDVEPKKEIPTTSLLLGLTFPARKVTACPEENGSVSQIYLCQGLNFVGFDSWRDPYVVYLETKKGRVSLKPSLDKENWRNIGSIYDPRSSAADVVKQYVNLFKPAVVELVVYGVVTNQASYLDLQKGEYHLSNKIISSGNRMDLLQDALTTIEEAKDVLNRKIITLESSLNRKESPGILESQRSRTVTNYYYHCRELFLNHMCPELEKDGVDLSLLQSEWKKQIMLILLKEYDSYIDRLGLSGIGLMKAEEIRRNNKQKEGKKRK